MLKRRQPPAGGAEIKPALPLESVVLCDLPLLRRHLSATAYDDGTPRTPGEFWFKNRGTCYEVVLMDPDAGARLPCRGPDMDAALALAEKLLGVEDAPWEIDKYLTEQLAKRRPAKRKTS